MATTKRIIKTIVMLPNGFYISASRWNDPIQALTAPVICAHPYGTHCNCRSVQALNDWRWIGNLGWFHNEENRAIYNAIVAAGVSLEGWHDREYDDVDLEIDVEVPDAEG